MTDLEYGILTYIKSKGKCPISYYDELNEDDQVVFRSLKKQELICYTDCEPDGLGGYCNCKSYTLTDKGKLALLAEDERLDAIDDQAAQDAHDKAKEHTLAVNKMAMDFIVSLISGKLAKIIEWIKTTF